MSKDQPFAEMKQKCFMKNEDVFEIDGWYYESKAYYVMAPVVSVLITAVGWNLEARQLWLVPAVMVVSLIVLSTWIMVENKQIAMKEA